MNELSKATPQVVGATEIIASLAAPRLFVSESAEDYAALRTVLVAELDPRTAYESCLVENLVRYEWEMARLRRYRDAEVLRTFRRLALNVLLTGDPSGQPKVSPKNEDLMLVQGLVSPDPEERRLAETVYCARCPWDLADLFGLAYSRAAEVGALEDRVADLERRRRTLRADYAALKAATKTSTVPDAEVVRGRW